jgi:hypothetical protein
MNIKMIEKLTDRILRAYDIGIIQVLPNGEIHVTAELLKKIAIQTKEECEIKNYDSERYPFMISIRYREVKYYDICTFEEKDIIENDRRIKSIYV